MLILYGIFIFWAGLIVGFLLLRWKFYRDFKRTSGTIHVTEDEIRHKTVYTLELDDYPETLRLKKVVIFKVDAPEEDRK
jgi:hypothetical protein